MKENEALMRQQSVIFVTAAVTLGIFFVVLKQWSRSWGCKGCKYIPKSFDLLKMYAKSQKIWEKKLHNFTTLLMKVHFLVIECMNKSLLHHRKHIKDI